MKITGYTIERQIGQGGMAIVYRAIQESLDRPVALKVMNPLYAENPAFSERFLNEGRILAALHHTHIMTIYDIGISDGFHYISMEYVDGGDLKQRLQQGVTPEQALNYAITVGHGLKAAHDADIVHRDIKPANILFRQDGTLLITDFGIAKQLAHTVALTATDNLLGSPAYLSPEQALQHPVDGRADIYSLGVVLYEMLAGVKPFDGDSPIGIAMQHIEGSLPELPPSLSHFQPLLHRMMAKNPEERFSNIGTMLQAAYHLKDRGWWNTATNDTAEAEKTFIIGTQPEHAFLKKPQQDRLTPKSTPASTISDNVWKSAIGIGVLVLGLSIVTIHLLSNPDRNRSVQTAATPAPPPAQVIPTQHTIDWQSLNPAGQTDRIGRIDRVRQIAYITQQMPNDQEEQAEQTAFTNTYGLNQQAKIDAWLNEAKLALADYRLTTPANHNAYFYYQQVQAIAPQHPQVTIGLDAIANQYLRLAKKAYDQGHDDKARRYLNLGLRVRNNHAGLVAFKAKMQRQDGSFTRPVNRLFQSVKKVFE